MMTEFGEYQAIESGIRKSANNIQPVDHARWQFSLFKRSRWPSQAWFYADWLHVETQLAHKIQKESLGHWLRINHDLPAGLKIGIRPTGGGVFLLTEVLIDHHQDIENDVASANQLLKQVEQICMQPNSGIPTSLLRQTVSKQKLRIGPDRPTSEQLVEAVTNCRLDFSIRENRVQLDMKGRQGVPLDLRLENSDRADTVLSQEISTVDQQESTEIRTARSLLLLLANFRVRFVRASESGVDRGTRQCWESAWYGVPNERQLSEAISALTVAHQLTDTELSALNDPPMAETFLQMLDIFN